MVPCLRGVLGDETGELPPSQVSKTLAFNPSPEVPGREHEQHWQPVKFA
jgi:hypothetical protein